jgi:hypothetical protein
MNGDLPLSWCDPKAKGVSYSFVKHGLILPRSEFAEMPRGPTGAMRARPAGRTVHEKSRGSSPEYQNDPLPVETVGEER